MEEASLEALTHQLNQWILVSNLQVFLELRRLLGKFRK